MKNSLINTAASAASPKEQNINHSQYIDITKKDLFFCPIQLSMKKAKLATKAGPALRTLKPTPNAIRRENTKVEELEFGTKREIPHFLLIAECGYSGSQLSHYKCWR